MTTPTPRSDFLGVYNRNETADNFAEFPFRVAISYNSRSSKEKTWINYGLFRSELAAARAYNIFAIRDFGKGAIINKCPDLSRDELVELNTFTQSTPKRQAALVKARAKYQAILEGGHTFRTHESAHVAQAAV